MPDATKLLNEIVGALDGLAAAIPNYLPDDRPINEIWGWQLPAINRVDLADIIKGPILTIRKIDAREMDQSDIDRLSHIPARISFITTNVLPNIAGGNAALVYSSITSMNDVIAIILSKYIDQKIEFEEVKSKSILPAAQLKELRKIAGAIEKLKVDSADLATKISEINSAHAVAQDLPADSQALVEARAEFNDAKNDLDKDIIEIMRHKDQIEHLHQELFKLSDEATRVMSNIDAAYSAATTMGLGKAFADRAKTLSLTTLGLGVILSGTLGLGGWISYTRVNDIHEIMSKAGTSVNLLWINVALAILSVSAPIWLAWLLTKQIGQRFRLAEDYGFKASVAKAYEGYRKEAMQIDPSLSKRLFESALSRFGEPPLRLIEAHTPGSPLHEIASAVQALRSPPKAQAVSPPKQSEATNPISPKADEAPT